MATPVSGQDVESALERFFLTFGMDACYESMREFEKAVKASE
jgi:hypothetical protein